MRYYYALDRQYLTPHGFSYVRCGLYKNCHEIYLRPTGLEQPDSLIVVAPRELNWDDRHRHGVFQNLMIEVVFPNRSESYRVMADWSTLTGHLIIGKMLTQADLHQVRARTEDSNQLR